MDLGALISQSVARIRKNLLLFLPPILTQIVLPLAFLSVASLTLFPLLVAFALTGDISGLIHIVGGFLLLVVGIFLADTFVTSGWAYMNRRVVIDGQTELADLWAGAKKYFLRILGGRVLVGFILVLPIVVGVASLVASILALNIEQLTPLGPDPITISGLVAPIVFELLGIMLVVGLIEFALCIFLLPWMQALVMDDLGIAGCIKSSFTFVRKNFATMIGYIVIYGVALLAASWLTSLVWPSFAYTDLMRSSTYMSGARVLELMLRASNIARYLVSALLSTFFTLLLFTIYADRGPNMGHPTVTEKRTTLRGSQASESTMTTAGRAHRGMKYCVNCGTPLIALAVFCPSCGARQPPLPPQ